MISEVVQMSMALREPVNSFFYSAPVTSIKDRFQAISSWGVPMCIER